MNQRNSKKKFINLSTHYPSIDIESNENYCPDTVRYYEETKCVVDIIDQMVKKYSVKAPKYIYIILHECVEMLYAICNISSELQTFNRRKSSSEEPLETGVLKISNLKWNFVKTTWFAKITYDASKSNVENA